MNINHFCISFWCLPIQIFGLYWKGYLWSSPYFGPWWRAVGRVHSAHVQAFAECALLNPRLNIDCCTWHSTNISGSCKVFVVTRTGVKWGHQQQRHGQRMVRGATREMAVCTPSCLNRLPWGDMPVSRSRSVIYLWGHCCQGTVEERTWLVWGVDIC